MNKVTICVFDYTGEKAIDPTKGIELGTLISNHISNKEQVILDFSNVTNILTLFLNPAIGDLYGTFSSEEIREKLELINISDQDKPVFKMVIERAKSFYANPKEWSEAIQEVLEDE